MKNYNASIALTTRKECNIFLKILHTLIKTANAIDTGTLQHLRAAGQAGDCYWYFS